MKYYELTYEDMKSARWHRAGRFADAMLSLVRDFIPNDRIVHRRFLEVMQEIGWEGNLEIINVKPEWDALNKLEIEHAMLEQHPVFVRMTPREQGEADGALRNGEVIFDLDSK